MRRRIMGASCVHGRVGAFYALCAGEGNQILQHYTSTSAEKICGHSMRIHQYLRKGLLLKGVVVCLGKRWDTVGEWVRIIRNL
jgi:hypothetical protein